MRTNQVLSSFEEGERGEQAQERKRTWGEEGEKLRTSRSDSAVVGG